MDANSIALFSVLAIGITTGCARNPRIQVNGFEVDAVTYNEQKEQVIQRASFEINCPVEQLEITVLKTYEEEVTQLGVSGCEKRLVYVRTGAGWILN